MILYKWLIWYTQIGEESRFRFRFGKYLVGKVRRRRERREESEAWVNVFKRVLRQVFQFEFQDGNNRSFKFVYRDQDQRGFIFYFVFEILGRNSFVKIQSRFGERRAAIVVGQLWVGQRFYRCFVVRVREAQRNWYGFVVEGDEDVYVVFGRVEVLGINIVNKLSIGEYFIC